MTTQRWCYIFIAFYTIMWTVTTYGIRQHLPLETIEALNWGRYSSFGYEYSPYLTAWLARLVDDVSNGADWAMYFSARLLLAVALWAVWQLACCVVDHKKAFIALLATSAVQYFNLHSVALTSDILMIALWAVAVYLFYIALQRGLWRYWFMLGIVTGMALATQYTGLVLLCSMVAYTVLVAKYRHYWRSGQCWLMLALVFIFFIPHIMWWHDTYGYSIFSWRLLALDHGTAAMLDHPRLGIGWWGLLKEWLLALFAMSVLLAGVWWHVRHEAAESLRSDDRLFFVVMCVLPIILLESLTIAGADWRWSGRAVIVFLPLTCLLFMPQIKRQSVVVATSWCTILLLAVSIIAYGLWFNVNNRSRSLAFYPGQDIALFAKQQWQQRYAYDVPVVVGNRYPAGSLAHYLPEHPLVFLEANNNIISIDDELVREKGALFVFNRHNRNQLHALEQRFPGVLADKIYHDFSWQHPGCSPIQMVFAFLPATHSDD